MRLLCIFIFLLFSCAEKKTDARNNKDFIFSESKTKTFQQKNLDSLKYAVEKKGDSVAYNKLVDYYYGDGDAIDARHEFIKLSKLMAEKYHYMDAYYYLYNSILVVENCTLENYNKCLNDKEKKGMIYYLKKSVQSGNEGARLDYINHINEVND